MAAAWAYCGLLLAAGGVVTAGAGMVEVDDAGGMAGFEVPRSLEGGAAAFDGVGDGPAASGLAAGAAMVVEPLVEADAEVCIWVCFERLARAL